MQILKVDIRIRCALIQLRPQTVAVLNQFPAVIGPGAHVHFGIDFVYSCLHSGPALMHGRSFRWG
jgi:hypothetical protein